MTTYGADRLDDSNQSSEQDNTSTPVQDSSDEDPSKNNSEERQESTEEAEVTIAFEDFPEDFQDLAKDRLRELGKVGVGKKELREVQTKEDTDVFEASMDDILSLEWILTTPVKQIPFHYIMNPQENFDQILFEYDVIQTIIMTQHGKDVLPDGNGEISMTEFMENIGKYTSYILSDARSRSGTTPKDMMEHINIVQASSTGNLNLDTTQFGDVSYLKYSNRIYGTQTDEFEEQAYRQINNFENTIRAYIGMIQNTYIATSQPLLDEMLENAVETPETEPDLDTPGFQ